MISLPGERGITNIAFSGEYTAILKYYYNAQSYVLEWPASWPESQGVNIDRI